MLGSLVVRLPFNSTPEFSSRLQILPLSSTLLPHGISFVITVQRQALSVDMYLGRLQIGGVHLILPSIRLTYIPPPTIVDGHLYHI